ncbi:MAG: nucleoside-diphosphate kinase [Patescibacteria group bacterium]
MRTEQTLVILKPDSIQRSLVGEVIRRYEQIGLKLVAMKMMMPSEELVEKHYTIDPEWMRLAGEKSINNAKKNGHTVMTESPIEMGQLILSHLKKYLTSGPVIAMVWRGAHAVAIVRKLTGSTEPLSSDVGTIRGDFVLDSYELSNKSGRAIRNLVHASTSVKEAEDEIKHWFSKEEIIEYSYIPEQVLY